MRFTVLKTHFDGMSGGHVNHGTIDEALNEVKWFKGWDSLDQLHQAIRAWSKHATPGSIFCTQVSAIVAVPGPGVRRRRMPSSRITETGSSFP